MTTPNIDDILLFAKVADLKNFTKTADQLNMAKSMVSKKISRLEHQLGVRLLNRSTRTMSLTESGKMLHEYSLRIQTDFQDAVQLITSDQESPKGIIKVMAPLSFGNYYLSKIMATFSEAYPDLSVELVLSAQIPNLIEAGIDVAIHIGQPADSNLMCRKIGMHQYTVCASPGYFKKHGKPETLEALENHKCLIHKHLPEANVWTFQQKNKTKKIKVKGNFISNSSQALKHAAINHSGIVMLPDYTVKTELEDGRLEAIFSEDCPQDIGLYALFPYTKHVSPKLRALLDYLIKNLG